MKFKRTRRILCFVLSLLLVLTLCAPTIAMAAEVETQSSDEVVIAVGETTTLKASGWSYYTTWESSDTDVATVSRKGIVTGIAPGTAIITAISKGFYFGKQTKTEFTVKVIEQEESDAIQIKVGETTTLPAPSESGTTTWKSSDTSIATVSSEGVVTGLSKGTVTVTATTKSGGYKFWFFIWGETITITKYTIVVIDDGEIPEPGKETFTVTFESNGGSAVEDQTVLEGDKVERPEDPTKEGYTFGGWYVDEELTTEYDFDVAVVEDITLYAKWEEVPPAIYKVIFESNGGSVVETQSVEEGKTVTKPADPIKEGYTFYGWYTDEELTIEYNFDAVVTDNITLYAKWISEEEIYIIDTDKDGLADEDEESYGTDPKNPDTDNDGYSDYEELILGTDPLTPNEYDETVDSDSDGLTDIEEVKNFKTNPYAVDTDGDGLSDYDEVNVYNTDPIKIDTDGDTLSDGFEVEHGLDPNKVSTDGIIDDNKVKIEQEMPGDGISSVLKDDSNLAKPSISGEVVGELVDNVFLASNTDSALDDNRAVIGKAVTIDGEDDYVKGLELTFHLEAYEGNLEELVIVILDEEGNFDVVDSTLSEKELSCQIEKSGTFCVLNLGEFLSSLGIELSSYWEEDELTTATTYSLELEDSSDEHANDIVKDEQVFLSDEEVTYSAMEATGTEEYEAQIDEEHLDELNETNASLLASTVSGQADIVFAIDTTGSMSSTINNVVTNVASFATTLSENYNVKVNYSLVEFKDLEADGPGTTKVIKNGSSNWFSDVDTFISKVNDLSASGGGDAPESDIDALETARRLDFRSSASKFIILITDASYKVANDYGIQSMEEEIELLKKDGIITSVVTSSSRKGDYQILYESTGGIFADISSSSFSSSLLALADLIGETTSDGTWVILKHGYRYVRLTDETDQDGDGLSTTYELGDEVELDLAPLIKVQLALHGVPYEEYKGKSTITVYNAKSDPTKEDTDNDGILDGKDDAPWVRGLKNGIVGALKICSYGDGAGSSAGIDGHAYLAYTSFITTDITLYGIKVNSSDEVAKKGGDDREERPEDHTFTIRSDDVISVGSWAGWLPDHLKGAWINNEYYLFNGEVSSDQTSLMKYITYSQMEKMESSVKAHSKWDMFYNCSAFAADVWNDTLEDDISAKGPWASPKSLAYHIQKRSGYEIAAPMHSEWP